MAHMKARKVRPRKGVLRSHENRTPTLRIVDKRPVNVELNLVLVSMTWQLLPAPGVLLLAIKLQRKPEQYEP